MEALPKNIWMQYNDDTLLQVRKLFDLDKPSRMDEAIDLLQDWVRKQPHYKKTEFDRHYLERYIIRAKGSVQKAKQRFEDMCILRTAFPDYYTYFQKPILVERLDKIDEALMPKQTDDFCTIYFMRNRETKYGDDWINQYFTRGSVLLEFFAAHDYNAGYIAVIDYRESDTLRLMATLANPTMIKLMTLFFKAHGSRINSVHIITNSSLLAASVHLFKPFMGDKIKRLQIHRSLESLYEHVDKDLLSVDYGGKEEPLNVLAKKMLEVISADETMTTLNDLRQATIDTKIKPVPEALSDTDLGVSGSFRNLSLD